MIRIIKAIAIIAIYCAGFVLLLPMPASADAGIPIFLAVYPIPAFAVLVPVILVEALILTTSGFSRGSAIKASALSNLVSTVIGIPITGGLFMLLEDQSCGVWADGPMTVAPWAKPPGKVIETLSHAAWLCPHDEQDIRWMAPVALLVLLVLFFVISCVCESLVVKALYKDMTAKTVFKACSKANLVSYALLALLPALDLLMYYGTGGRDLFTLLYPASDHVLMETHALSR